MSISLKNDAGTFSTNLNQSNPTANVNIALPTTSGTMAKAEDKLVLGTAYTFTGTETFKGFTGIPSWAKRITVMFNAVSTSGTANQFIQLGAGSFTTSGYVSAGFVVAATSAAQNSSTAGFLLNQVTGATASASGVMTITNITGNTWVYSCTICNGTSGSGGASGNIVLGGTLDRLRLTTSNGTDTFDAGTINIMWE